MEIEEADSVTLTDQVTSTRVIVATATVHHHARRDSSEGGSVSNKSTQTLGHVFLGKQGEVIISTNYTLVKLVVNEEAVHALTKSGSDVDTVTDTVLASLARLDWNGERILDRAMTSFRLTLTRDLMPLLLEQVTDLLKTEHDHHKVQLLAQQLLEKQAVRLFGLEVGSLSFLLEHSSVNDAHDTLASAERQQELWRLLFAFLPDWVARFAEVTVSAYVLSQDDRRGAAEDFGFRCSSSVSFVASVSQLVEGSSSTSKGPKKVRPEATKIDDVKVSVREAGESGAQTPSQSRRSFSGAGAVTASPISDVTAAKDEPKISISPLRSPEEPQRPRDVELVGAAASTVAGDYAARSYERVQSSKDVAPKRGGWTDKVKRDEEFRMEAKNVKRKSVCCIM